LFPGEAGKRDLIDQEHGVDIGAILSPARSRFRRPLEGHWRNCSNDAEPAAFPGIHWDSATEHDMGFDQYHEPPEELSQKVRTFARMITSLIEEAEAISWYEQRMSVEKDPQARAIMKNAQGEEFKHFGMNLEFLLRQKKDWRAELKEILFTTGDIVKAGEAGEKKVD
jgi:hypothetical protein